MGVTFGNDRRGGRQLDLIGSFRHDAFTAGKPRKDADPLAVALAGFDFAFEIPVIVDLHVDEIDALLLGERRNGNGNNVLPSRNTSTNEPGTTSPVLSNSKVTGI